MIARFIVASIVAALLGFIGLTIVQADKIIAAGPLDGLATVGFVIFAIVKILPAAVVAWKNPA